MNARPIALVLLIACQTAFAGPSGIADTGTAIAAQSATAAAQIRFEQRQALHRTPYRLVLPAPTAGTSNTPPGRNTPVATLAQPPINTTKALHRQRRPALSRGLTEKLLEARQ
jgi:hypothetical protein